MADVNSIQEEQEQTQATESKGLNEKLQKILAPMQGLFASLSPQIQKLKQNKIAFYSVLGGGAVLVLLLLLLLILALMPSKKTKKPEQEATQESVVNEISQERSAKAH